SPEVPWHLAPSRAAAPAGCRPRGWRGLASPRPFRGSARPLTWLLRSSFWPLPRPPTSPVKFWALTAGLPSSTISRGPDGRLGLEFDRTRTSQKGSRMDGSSYEKFKGIIAEQLGVEPAQITPDASFVDDLNADSLDLVELIMEFEEEYGMEIPDEDAEKIQTVGAAWDYVQEKLGITT